MYLHLLTIFFGCSDILSVQLRRLIPQMFKTGFEPKTLVKLEETCSIIFALQRDFQFIYRKQSQFDA